MIPFLELKLAIPLGSKLGLSTVSTLMFAVPGTIIPGAILLAILGPITNWARKHSQKINLWLTTLFNKTRTDHSARFNRYGALFLILFVAIPLPGSSAGAAATVAFIFGVDYWRALSLITVGTLIAGLLIAGGVESVVALINLFN